MNAQGPQPAIAPACEIQHERQALRLRIDAARHGEISPLPQGRLTALAELFQLNLLETDIVSELWANAFDSEIGGAATEARRELATVESIAALFHHPLRVHLNSESPLRLWRIVEERISADGPSTLTLDPAVLAWLENHDESDRMLVGRVFLLSPGLELAHWPVENVARKLREGLRTGQRWRVQLVGDDALAACWFAAALGRRLGIAAAHVPAGALPSLSDAAVRLHRQCFLSSNIPCIASEDAQLSQPEGVLPYPVQIVHGPRLLTPADTAARDLVVELPAPDANDRDRLWRFLWPQCVAWPRDDYTALVLCHEAGVSDIAAAAGAAPESAREAAQFLRDRIRGDLGALARHSDTEFRWSDLVLPEAVEVRLREIAFEARERARVWADPAAARLFPYGRGLVALFAGPPGTGKTMAAQVIADDIGLDLFSVDISAVVSKWVGETAQHIQQLLSSRTAQRSVLFFDECDALFAKRVEEVRDAQDRYVNLDTSHLMAALESYPGIVIMASNLKGNIDTAFLRRIRHVVDFPKPSAAAREQIWRRVVRALFEPGLADALELQLPRVARIEATGALIKNAALSALFASRRSQAAPDAQLLGQMLARELAKEGAGLSSRELQALLEPAS